MSYTNRFILILHTALILSSLLNFFIPLLFTSAFLSSPILIPSSLLLPSPHIESALSYPILFFFRFFFLSPISPLLFFQFVFEILFSLITFKLYREEQRKQRESAREQHSLSNNANHVCT